MNIVDFVSPQLLYSQEEANVIKKVEPIGWYSFIASRLFAANKLYIGIGSEDDKDINWFCLVKWKHNKWVISCHQSPNSALVVVGSTHILKIWRQEHSTFSSFDPKASKRTMGFIKRIVGTPFQIIGSTSPLFSHCTS